MYSLSTSFWMVPVSAGGGDALLLGDELVQQQQQRGGSVDRHRGRHLVERDAVEQHPHVLDRVDRHADLADLAVGDRGVGVVAHLGRQVEGHGQPGRAVRDQLVVARVGLGRGAEPGVLAHRPGPAGVHRGVDAAGVGVRARALPAARRDPSLSARPGRRPARSAVRTATRAPCACLPPRRAFASATDCSDYATVGGRESGWEMSHMTAAPGESERVRGRGRRAAGRSERPVKRARREGVRGRG